MFRIFGKRVEGLEEARKPGAKAKKLSFWAGRVLHYIQDLSVPAHVMPAFHGPGEPYDGFDAGGVKAKIDAHLGTIDAKWCDRVSRIGASETRVNRARAILNSNAAATMKHKEEAGEVWAHLWLESDETSPAGKKCEHGRLAGGRAKRFRLTNFGCYSDCEFAPDAECETCPGVTREQMRELYARQYAQGLEHSVALLMYAEDYVRAD